MELRGKGRWLKRGWVGGGGHFTRVGSLVEVSSRVFVLDFGRNFKTKSGEVDIEITSTRITMQKSWTKVKKGGK